jgi:hypothetical protein
MISGPTTMLSVVWNPHGFHMVKVLPRRCKWTKEYESARILPEVCPLHLTRDRRKLVGYADIASAHVSTRVKPYMEDCSVRTTQYRGYSPELAPKDFFLVNYLERALQGAKSQSLEELLKVAVRILNAIPTDTLIGTFQEWIKRLQARIDDDEEYGE